MKTLLFILLFIPMMGFGQQWVTLENYSKMNIDTFHIDHTKNDTIKVVMLVSDTTHHYTEYIEMQTCKEAGCPDSIRHKDNIFISHYKKIKQEYGSIERQTFLKIGYAVRELRRTDMTADTHFYRKLLRYLGSDKKPLPKTVIVWQSQLITSKR